MNPAIRPPGGGVVRRLSAVFILCLPGLWLLPVAGRAQTLVADGQTNVLDNVSTNIGGGLIVGNLGSFTLLVITNGAMVTNTSGTSSIGNGAAANTNHVVVTGAGSILNNIGTLYIGASGSGNELDVLNGGRFSAANSAIGESSSSSRNLVVVSDAGSVWTNNSTLYVGNNSARNTLIVTNGGKVFSGSSGAGQNGNGSNNVVITGAGSGWSSGYTYLGYIGSGIGRNQILVNNGGNFTSSSVLDIGVYSSTNNFTVADTDSLAQCQTYRMGYSSSANQCVVSNGATLTVASASQATVIEGTYTVAAVTGAGSVWTNAGDLDFGQFSNTLAITSGGKMMDVNGYVENGNGKPNTVIVAGAGSLWKNSSELHVDDLGAQLIITNGGMVSDISGTLGDNAGQNNCYALVSGAGSVWSNSYNLFVGYNGSSNQLVVADSGRVSVAMNFNAEYNAGVLVTGSGTLSADFFNVGNGGSRSQMVVSNGGKAYANYFQIGNGQSNTVIVAGGTVFVTNSAALANHATLVLNSGWFKANSLSVSGGSQTNLVVFNGGTLLSGTTSYATALPFVVGDGTDTATFQMLNNGTHTFLGGLMISSNATLTGVGTVTGATTINNGGTLAPGTNSSLGTIALNSNLALNAAATTFMKLNATGAYGIEPSDTITVATNLVYAGTLSLTNVNFNSLLNGSFYSFQLFSASNYSGAFSSIVPVVPLSQPWLQLRWDTNELNVDGVLRIFPAVSPPPVVVSTALGNGCLLISARAGFAYDPCWLLTTTNLAAPVWTCVATNYFDVTGSTSFTNPVAAGEPARYFKLQVN